MQFWSIQLDEFDFCIHLGNHCLEQGLDYFHLFSSLPLAHKNSILNILAEAKHSSSKSICEWEPSSTSTSLGPRDHECCSQLAGSWSMMQCMASLFRAETALSAMYSRLNNILYPSQ